MTLDKGLYKAVVTKWGLGVSKEKKTPQFSLTFVLRSFLQGGKEVPCTPYERTLFRYFTDDTIDFVAKDLRALGYKHDTFDQLEPDHPEAHDFSDAEIKVELAFEKYQGKDKERWELRMGGGFQPEKIDRSGVSKLNAVFCASLKKTPAAAAPPKAAPTPATQYDPSQYEPSHHAAGNSMPGDTQTDDGDKIPF